MSLHRFVYYSAVIGGWAAFLAWLVCEVLFLRNRSLGGWSEAVVTGAVVGAALGAGLNLVSGMTNARWTRQLRRLTPGLLGGGIGGAVGALCGALMYSTLGLPRAFGWMIMGLGIGGAEGVYERSKSKTRNGLIGGALGGMVGGLLFDPIKDLAPAGLWTFSRAIAFAILGVSTGALIGLAHVVLKEAWLTVVDGFRPGRQLILSQAVTVLGRGDHLPLPFLGYSGKDLESEHLRIVRQEDGTYFVEDKGSRVGTRVNVQVILGPTMLADGDLIKLGTNIVRFNHRHRGKEEQEALIAIQPPVGNVGIAAPPPPPGTAVGQPFLPAGPQPPPPPGAAAREISSGAPPPPLSPPPGQPLPASGSRPGLAWKAPRAPAPPAPPGASPSIPPPPPPPGKQR